MAKRPQKRLQRGSTEPHLQPAPFLQCLLTTPTIQVCIQWDLHHNLGAKKQ